MYTWIILYLITIQLPVISLRGQCLVLLFLLYINDFNRCSAILDFHLFADDSNLFYKHENILLQAHLNKELKNIYYWLCANRLSLNINKSNFVIFHAPQKKITNEIKLYVNGTELKRSICIKYLGILIDLHLSWKDN